MFEGECSSSVRKIGEDMALLYVDMRTEPSLLSFDNPDAQKRAEKLCLAAEACEFPKRTSRESAEDG